MAPLDSRYTQIGFYFISVEVCLGINCIAPRTSKFSKLCRKFSKQFMCPRHQRAQRSARMGPLFSQGRVLRKELDTAETRHNFVRDSPQNINVTRPVGDDRGESGPLVLVDGQFRLPDELLLHPVRADGRHAAHRLPKVGVDGGPRGRLQPFQLPRGRNVDPERRQMKHG